LAKKRNTQTFEKRRKEEKRRRKQQEKRERRFAKKNNAAENGEVESVSPGDGTLPGPSLLEMEETKQDGSAAEPGAGSDDINED